MPKPLHPITERIEILREAKGLSKSELGAAAGKSHGWIASLISRGTAPKPDDLASVALALGVSVADLMSGPGEMRESEAEPYRPPAPPGSEIGEKVESALIATLAPGTRRGAIYRITSARSAAAGYLPGDVAIIDLGRAPEPGEHVVATLADLETGAARTILRRLSAGALIDTAPEAEEPVLFLDDQRIGILGPVVASFRPPRER